MLRGFSCIVSFSSENLINLIPFIILEIFSAGNLIGCCQGSKQIPKAQTFNYVIFCY